MSDFNAGRHEEAIEMLTKDMAFVKDSVRRIELHLAEKKGERRSALYVAGAVGSIVPMVLAAIAKKLGFI